jgi:membrane protein
MQSRIRRIWHSLKYYVVGLVRRADRDNAILLAGGLAFFTFLCIVPFVLIIFSILGLLLEKSALEKQIYSMVSNIIPYKDYAEHVKDLLHTQIVEFRLYKSIAGIAGLGGLLFAASGLFSAIRTILNTVFRLEQVESPFWGKLRDFGKDIGMVTLVLCYFLLSTTFLPALSILKKYSKHSEFLGFFRFGFAGDLFTGILAFGLIFIAFFLMYYMIPRVKLAKKAILVSTFSAAVLWEIAKQIFGFYITDIASMGRIYGVYTLIVIIAFWIYYTSIILILGAELGQLYRESKSSDLIM